MAVVVTWPLMVLYGRARAKARESWKVDDERSSAEGSERVVALR